MSRENFMTLSHTLSVICHNHSYICMTVRKSLKQMLLLVKYVTTQNLHFTVVFYRLYHTSLHSPVSKVKLC